MYFNREFENLERAILQDLRTLESEGNIYSQFWYEEFEEFRYCRIPFEPNEIVEFVESLTAYNEFLGFRYEGLDESEALSRISNDRIKERVREYNDWAREEGLDQTFVPAAFYSTELESLLSGHRKERYEFVDQGFEGDKRELLRDIITQLSLSVNALHNRSNDRPPFEISCEQDIHDLLYAVLKPIFPESRVEEYTTKHAGSSKRIDKVLPEISTGIEIKYIGNSTHAKEVGDELKTDIESYHVHENCNNMIAVIWDSESHIEDPYNFVKDMEGPRVYDGQEFPVEIEIVG